MILGDVSAIGSAFTWAVGGLLLRSQTRRVDAVTLNALQYTFAAVFFVSLAAMTGRIGMLASAPMAALLWVVGGSTIGMIGGDTLYVRSLARSGMARTFPITASLYMLLAYMGSVVILKEPFYVNAAAGGVLIAAGISLVVWPASGENRQAGGAAALLSPDEIATMVAVSACWAVATMCIRTGMLELDPLTANVARLPVAAVLLVTLSTIRQRGPHFASYGWQPLAATAGSGLVGISLGSLLFLYALQTAGAGRTSILSSVSPLFAVPLSVVFFRERFTWRLALGTLLCVAGTWAILLG